MTPSRKLDLFLGIPLAIAVAGLVFTWADIVARIGEHIQ